MTAIDLTQRYIAATVSSLPAASREDVRAELGTSIADAIESRIEQGEERGAAERAVLTDLGDPARLAAGFADLRLQLIGPRHYLTWRRLLILLESIVPACALVGVALAQVLSEAPVGTVIGQSISVALTAAVHVAFWVTLVFAILERTDAETGEEWTLEDLPEERGPDLPLSDLIASIVVGVLVIGAVLWDLADPVVQLDDHAVSVLAPSLWPGWIAVLLGVVVLEVALTVMVHRRGAWTTPFAVVNTALSLVFLSWALTLIARGELINPELVRLVLTDNGVGGDTPRILAVLLAAGIAISCALDVADGWRKALRARRV
ncbi:permease prefix domain 1-containing protein [Brachybacterium sp. J153]|uniref:permease prefix domain 1-containing protein n=1 Tax=Brachybacterium sp. J153 TaxID=3116488 RepID=UPI002E791F26|nr:permease prefix domain 1-containing protein [Brachybacterium sp. J153]MEE1619604.1 permease prefix domain 1-containing protein [Brachybacterium sp. J153]